MKKTIFLFALCICSQFLFAQEKIRANLVSMEIPNECKSQINSIKLLPKDLKVIDSVVTIGKIKGRFRVEFDKKNKIVFIGIDPKFNPSSLTPVQREDLDKCLIRCEDKPSDAGVILCVSNCVSRAILRMIFD